MRTIRLSEQLPFTRQIWQGKFVLTDQPSCIVVSGLSSYPFGSWKQRGGSFMWLRDDAAWRSPNVRTLLYGYDTSLAGSESAQDIDDIGHKLGDFITRIRSHRMVSRWPSHTRTRRAADRHHREKSTSSPGP